MFCRIIWVYVSVGIWVYPLLGLFSTAGLAGFFFFNMCVVTLLYLLGDKLNSCVWGKRRQVCLIIQTSQRSHDNVFNLSLCLTLSFVSFLQAGIRTKAPKKQNNLSAKLKCALGYSLSQNVQHVHFFAYE